MDLIGQSLGADLQVLLHRIRQVHLHWHMLLAYFLSIVVLVLRILHDIGLNLLSLRSLLDWNAAHLVHLWHRLLHLGHLVGMTIVLLQFVALTHFLLLLLLLLVCENVLKPLNFISGPFDHCFIRILSLVLWRCWLYRKSMSTGHFLRRIICMCSERVLSQTHDRIVHILQLHRLPWRGFSKGELLGHYRLHSCPLQSLLLSSCDLLWRLLNRLHWFRLCSHRRLIVECLRYRLMLQIVLSLLDEHLHIQLLIVAHLLARETHACKWDRRLILNDLRLQLGLWSYRIVRRRELDRHLDLVVLCEVHLLILSLLAAFILG